MTKKDRRPAPATSAVHGGEPRTYSHDALAAPIYQTATYTFADTAEEIVDAALVEPTES